MCLTKKNYGISIPKYFGVYLTVLAPYSLIGLIGCEAMFLVNWSLTIFIWLWPFAWYTCLPNFVDSWEESKRNWVGSLSPIIVWVNTTVWSPVVDEACIVFWIMVGLIISLEGLFVWETRGYIVLEIRFRPYTMIERCRCKTLKLMRLVISGDCVWLFSSCMLCLWWVNCLIWIERPSFE